MCQMSIMKLVFALLAMLALFFPPTCLAFVPSTCAVQSSLSSSLSSSGALPLCLAQAYAVATLRHERFVLHALNDNTNDSSRKDKRMAEIMAEEAMNAANLKASAAEMAKMKPEDLERMIGDLERMPAAQKAQLQSMGMDLDTMKISLQMMKENPAMLKDMEKLMSSMTPDELLEKSRQAQEALKKSGVFPPPNVASTPTTGMPPTKASTGIITDAEIVREDEGANDKDDDDDEEEEDDETIEPDQDVLDAMYRVGEIMSMPPEQGGVTLAAFGAVPPIAVLSGDGEDDLSSIELRECWNKGSLGATRVDRAGFERVWREVQDNFYNDVVEEARDRLLIRKKKKRGTEKPAASVAATPSTIVSPSVPMVGQSLTPEQLKKEMANLKDDDLVKMLENMSSLSPAEAERMRSMGVDPEMMKKSASMMKSNPLLRKAAAAMMRNMSPEQMMKASQDAQQKMAGMSEEDRKRMLENFK